MRINYVSRISELNFLLAEKINCFVWINHLKVSLHVVAQTKSCTKQTLKISSFAHEYFFCNISTHQNDGAQIRVPEKLKVFWVVRHVLEVIARLPPLLATSSEQITLWAPCVNRKAIRFIAPPLPKKSLDFLGTPYMLELWLGRSIIISCWSRREPINSQVLYLNVYRSLKRGLGAFDTTLVQQRNVAEILIFDCQVSDRGMGNYTSIYIKSLFMMFLWTFFFKKFKFHVLNKFFYFFNQPLVFLPNCSMANLINFFQLLLS